MTVLWGVLAVLLLAGGFAIFRLRGRQPHAEPCPICDGSGYLSEKQSYYDYDVATGQSDEGTTGPAAVKCNACDGTGLGPS